MRVLYVCHRVPYPPDKGDKIRAFHQIRAIAAQHEVDVFTLADDARDLVHREALAAYCHQVTVARMHPMMARLRSLPYLLTRTPLTIPYFYSAKLAAEIRAALSKRCYDRVFVYCSAMAQYVETAGSTPIVMDLVDVDSDKWWQYAACTRFPFSTIYRREGRTLQKFERRACERAAYVLVSTEREARLVQQISPRTHVSVILNGVDCEYFKPVPQAAEPAVIFTGDMSYFPNQEAVIYFARKVLPLIRRAVAGARFLIVGRNPGRNVRELAQIEGIEVTGYVPDVRKWLAKARLAVAPFTIAAGIQNKILEAMAFGIPVVATPCAAQGLLRRVADIVDTGDTAEELASKVTALLRDPNLSRRKGIDGRVRVIEAYNWDRELYRLLRLLEDPATAELPHARPQSFLV